MESGVARTRLDVDIADRFLPLRRQLAVTAFGLNQIVLRPRQRGLARTHPLPTPESASST